MHLSTATAFWITAPQHAELQPVDLPLPGESDVVVKTLYSAISRGTESLVFNGKVPVSEHQRMKAPFQVGEFTFPVKYGYINIGEVEHGPASLAGCRVFCLYPHQSRYVVPASAVTLLPDSVPAERAVLAANMETAINTLWDAAPSVGDRISVVGGGVLGCLVAWLAAQIPGCEVELIDTNPDRGPIAQTLGVSYRSPDNASTSRDLVIHASASEQGLNTALSLAGFEATVIELSWYGDRAVAVHLGGAFHSQRLTVRGSQVGHIPATQRARWDYQRRLKLALSLLTDKALDCLISSESLFHELPSTFPDLMKSNSHVLCHRIRYDHHFIESGDAACIA